MLSSYNEDLFRRQVLAALKSARTVLDAERQPAFFGDDNDITNEASQNDALPPPPPHSYDDKFAVAELLTNTSIAAISNVWNGLGLSPDHQRTILAWHHGTTTTASTSTTTGTNTKKEKQTVTLRFVAHDTCTFLKEVDVDVPMSGGDHVVTTKTEKSASGLLFGTSMTSTQRTETVAAMTRKIKEYHWKVGLEYQLLVFPANLCHEQGIVLQSRKTETVLITQQQKSHPPLPERTLHGAVDVSLDWFLSQIDPIEQACQFAIVRDDPIVTKTPRRNVQVYAAVQAHQAMKEWSRLTQGFFLHRVEREMLGQDHPAVPRPTTTPITTTTTTTKQHRSGGGGRTNTTSIIIMEPGSTGRICGLSKEPTFNGHRVRIISYDHASGRYKAEPIILDPLGHPSPQLGFLPPTLSIKPENIQPDRNDDDDDDDDDDDSTAVVIGAGPPLSTITDEGVLLPTLPLVDRTTGAVVTNVSELLQEQARTLDEALDGLTRVYPSRQLVKLVSVAEASIVLLCKHLERLCRMLQDGLDHVEHLLEKQLLTAIGKASGIGPIDFHDFMTHHYPRLFGPLYTPVPFCRAIRQPGHFPDGIIAIEKDCGGGRNGGPPQPIATWMRTVSGASAPPIRLPIHAAASVEITGDRFLHGWMMHQFGSSSSSETPLAQLACRARQFSSFLVVLGTVAGPDSFEPKEAIILQNKDEVLIPLILTPLPSAKAFRDAIHSLSPEQQEFAKAYRGMQLSSSVFGVCVIQLKPQLEKLLELPTGSLTKEIKLTQDLMSLFVDYQIPSDMLTYDGAADASAADKLTAVKGYVKNVLDVIDESKLRQLKEEEMKADMRTEVGHKKNKIGFSGAVTAPDYDAVSCSVASPFSLPSAVPSHTSMGNRAFSGVVHAQSRSMAFSAAPPHSQNVAAPHYENQQLRLAYSANALPPKPTDNDKRDVSKSGKYDSKTSVGRATASTTPVGAASVDFTLIPKILDAKLEELDSDGALRSIIIKASDRWIRSRQENLLVQAATSVLTAVDISHETKRAFDLLDCLSRSGTLPIACAELHVFVAVSHHFEKECVQTIVQDNINPIAKVERSALILASTTFGVSPGRLLQHQPEAAGRLRASFPHLFALENHPTTT